MAQADSDEARLARQRRALVDTFCALPGEGSLIDLQRRVAGELQESLVHTDESRDILSHHKHLVRIVGDALAFTLLPEHTIRTLSRHPGPPAHVAEGDDLQFVFDIASRLANAGYLPILCDLTNLLRVGDIVAVSADHILVLECKNSPLPMRLRASDRRARQRKRGGNAASYLRDSQIVEAGVIRQALSGNAVNPRWQILTELAGQLEQGQDGAAIAKLGDGDVVAIATSVDALDGIFSAMREAIGCDSPLMGLHTDLIEEPGWNHPNPVVYPLPARLRWQLLEGDAIMLRFVDPDQFQGSLTDDLGRTVELRLSSKSDLAIVLDGREHQLGPRFVDQVLFTPTAVKDMRDALLADMRAFVDHIIEMEPVVRQLQDEGVAPAADAQVGGTLASGDSIDYGTVYLDASNRPVILYQLPDSIGQADHVVWSPIDVRPVALYTNGVRVDLVADDGQIDTTD